MDTLEGKAPCRLAASDTVGVWQLRRVGPPSTVQNSASLIRLKEDGEVTVGRGPAADYFLDSAITLRLISRIHASVIGERQTNGRPKFTITNNGLNGTYINDIKMGFHTENKRVLCEGDKITFGHPGCASIEPGQYAPQPKSEFQFIFECVPASRAKSLERHHNHTRVLPHSGNSKHQRQFDENPGPRLADSPHSNASTSEKENDIAISTAYQDVKSIVPSLPAGGIMSPSKMHHAGHQMSQLEPKHDQPIKYGHRVTESKICNGLEVDKTLPLTICTAEPVGMTCPPTSKNCKVTSPRKAESENCVSSTNHISSPPGPTGKPVTLPSSHYNPLPFDNVQVTRPTELPRNDIEVHSTTIILCDEEDEGENNPDDDDGDDDDDDDDECSPEIDFMGETGPVVPVRIKVEAEYEDSDFAVDKDRRDSHYDDMPQLLRVKDPDVTDADTGDKAFKSNITNKKSTESTVKVYTDIALSERAENIPRTAPTFSDKAAKEGPLTSVCSEPQSVTLTSAISKPIPSSVCFGSEQENRVNSIVGHSSVENMRTPNLTTEKSPVLAHKYDGSKLETERPSVLNHNLDDSKLGTEKLSMSTHKLDDSNLGKERLSRLPLERIPSIQTSPDHKSRSKDYIAIVTTSSLPVQTSTTSSSSLSAPLSSQKSMEVYPVSTGSFSSRPNSSGIPPSPKPTSPSVMSPPHSEQSPSHQYGSLPSLTQSTSNHTFRHAVTVTSSETLIRLEPAASAVQRSPSSKPTFKKHGNDLQHSSLSSSTSRPSSGASIQSRSSSGASTQSRSSSRSSPSTSRPSSRATPLRLSPSSGLSDASRASSRSCSKKLFVKDTVPNMYSSSDEGETFEEDKSKIVKKIYSPARRKTEETGSNVQQSRRSTMFKGQRNGIIRKNAEPSSPTTSLSSLSSSKSSAAAAPQLSTGADKKQLVRSGRQDSLSSPSSPSSSDLSDIEGMWERTFKTPAERKEYPNSVKSLTPSKSAPTPKSMSVSKISTPSKSAAPSASPSKSSVSSASSSKSSAPSASLSKSSAPSASSTLSTQTASQRTTVPLQSSAPSKTKTPSKLSTPVQSSGSVNATLSPKSAPVSKPSTSSTVASSSSTQTAKITPVSSSATPKLSTSKQPTPRSKTIALASLPWLPSETSAQPSKSRGKGTRAGKSNIETTSNKKDTKSLASSSKSKSSALATSRNIEGKTVSVLSPPPPSSSLSSSSSSTRHSGAIQDLSKDLRKDLSSSLNPAGASKSNTQHQGKDVTSSGGRGTKQRSGLPNGSGAQKRKLSPASDSMSDEDVALSTRKVSKQSSSRSSRSSKAMLKEDSRSNSKDSTAGSVEKRTTRRGNRAATKNAPASSSSAKGKGKRSSSKKGKPSKAKRKRKTQISDTTSEEDDDNIEEDDDDDDEFEEEEEDESDSWELPDGVQYYDNECSAVKCLNPVGKQVDWVMCDYCEKWYHVVCVDCPLDVVQKEDIQFHCGYC